jgi:ribosomal protein S21
MKWLKGTVEKERRALEAARRRFVSKPTEKRLHSVRTAGRRFRSLLEDVAELSSCGFSKTASTPANATSPNRFWPS